jgi:hypothetical protein
VPGQVRTQAVAHEVNVGVRKAVPLLQVLQQVGNLEGDEADVGSALYVLHQRPAAPVDHDNVALVSFLQGLSQLLETKKKKRKEWVIVLKLVFFWDETKKY